MTVTSQRSISTTFAGDQVASWKNEAAENLDSPGMIQVVTLASGNNTITVPTGGTIPTAVTILKPSDNAVALTLKGVSGDTGIRLHDTDPDSISIDDGVVTFVLNAGAQLVGVRLVWS